jgi:uncharacterized membrane protein YvbJ
MTKAELIAEIGKVLPEALTLDDKATNAQLEAVLETLESAAKLEDAKEELAKANEVVATLTAEVDAHKASIEELNNALTIASISAAKSTNSAAIIVEHEGGKYCVKHGGTIIFEEETKVYTKEEIAGNAALLTYLIGIGSGLVEEV